MSSSYGDAAAFDASVYSDSRETAPSLRESKSASAVEFFGRELEKAEVDVVAAQKKVETQQFHLDGAVESARKVEEKRDQLRNDLEAAQSQLEEMVDAEVTP